MLTYKNLRLHVVMQIDGHIDHFDALCVRAQLSLYVQKVLVRLHTDGVHVHAHVAFGAHQRESAHEHTENECELNNACHIIVY